MTEDKVITTNGGSVNTQDANFANDVTLAEGVRISVEIGTGLTTTNTTPTLNVDGTGDKTIVRQDGSALAVGDLKEGQYCDFIYAASGGSHIQDKWVWLNSPYAQLITSLKQDIAANIYPVGSIFTTTTNYSAAGNGAAVTTALGMASTVQWSRFAQGRTIVGADLGTTITSATSSSNVVTLTVSSHGLSAGDSITVSGFTSDTDANGTDFTVDSTTSTNIVYTASNVSDGSLTGSNLLVINNAFDAGDTGGASNHVLSQAEMNHNHQVYDNDAGGDRSIRCTDEGTHGKTFDASADAVGVTSGSGGSMTIDMFTDNNRGITGETVTAHNNLQPYITTYIWKRTA